MNIKDLQFDKKNYNKGTEQGDKLLDKSIRKFGYRQPAVVDKNGNIVAGNKRIAKAGELGIDEVNIVKGDPNKITVIQFDDFDLENDKLTKEYALADNQVAKVNIEIDTELALGELGIEIGAEWCISQEIQQQAIEDSVADVPENETIITQFGDIYEIINLDKSLKHTLICGDSTKIETYAKILEKSKADMVVTSPPYWVGFAYEQEKNEEEIKNHIRDVSVNLSVHTNGRIIINTANIASVTISQKIFGKKQVDLLIDRWRDELNLNGYLARHIRIWAKEGQVRPSSNSDSVDMHWEYIGEFLDNGFSANFVKEDAIWRGQNKIGEWANKWSMSGLWLGVKGNARDNGHVASFPVEIPWRLIQLYSNQGDIVLEPYGGSGTTLIACEQLKRNAKLIELDTNYCDLIINRYIKFNLDNDNCKIVIKRNGDTLYNN